MIYRDIKEDILNIVEDNLEKAKEELGIEFVLKDTYIYGSMITDKAKPNDIDLYLHIIVEDDPYSEYGYFDMINEEYSKLEYYAAEKVHTFLHDFKNQPLYNNMPLDMNIQISPPENILNPLLIEDFFFKNIQNYYINEKEKLKKSDIPNIFNNEEAKSSFIELANLQRDIPEKTMLKAQNLMRGGLLPDLLEHIGDLTHRISQRTYVDYGNIEQSINDILPKINKGLNFLKSKYGFEKEVEENINNNFKFYKEKKDFPYSSLEEYKQAINEVLNEYALEHSKLPVYNSIQKSCRDAAISLGKKDFKECIYQLEYLKNSIENKSFLRKSSIYEKKYEQKLTSNIQTDSDLSSVPFINSKKALNEYKKREERIKKRKTNI